MYLKMLPEPGIQWHIGCSGFYYKEWKEIFYPKGLAQKNWFSYYCEHFNTLELNVTFYRFPQSSFLENWYQKSPASFTFSVKAPKLITHYKVFNETESLLRDFYDTIREGLREKLGPVLFQFFSNVHYSETLLSRIITQLDPSFVNVLEFRHASWWNPSVFERLAKHKIIFCGISHPVLPDQVVINLDIVYYRFHGVPQLYYSVYPQEFLDSVMTKIKSQPAVQHAYLYFNNTATGSAILNAQYLLQQYVI
jgi:uncharacterized protein YecE (DUF72 family)